MQRAFKKFTIQSGGTPQPAIGTWITASVNPGSVGGTDFQGETLTTITVSDTSMFQEDDYVYIIDANLANPERCRVTDVFSSTSMEVFNMKNSRTGGVFGTGAFVALSINVNSVYIQTTIGNTGAIYVGLQGIVKATFKNVIAILQQVTAPTQPIDFSDSRTFAGPNISQSSDFWVDGTSGDGYLPSLGIV